MQNAVCYTNDGLFAEILFCRLNVKVIKMIYDKINWFWVHRCVLLVIATASPALETGKKKENEAGLFEAFFLAVLEHDIANSY